MKLASIIAETFTTFTIIVLWPAIVIGAMHLIWVMPQERFRFSIRTLFVSMTVVALLMGLAVYVSRR